MNYGQVSDGHGGLDDILPMIVDPNRGPGLFPGFSFRAGTKPSSISSFTRDHEEIDSLNKDL